jgi:hypothetical protein
VVERQNSWRYSRTGQPKGSEGGLGAQPPGKEPTMIGGIEDTLKRKCHGQIMVEYRG